MYNFLCQNVLILYRYRYIDIDIYSNSICFITKVLNIIHKQQCSLYQDRKEIKPSYQVLRVSCKRVLQSSASVRYVQAEDCNARLHETLST